MLPLIPVIGSIASLLLPLATASPVSPPRFPTVGPNEVLIQLNGNVRLAAGFNQREGVMSINLNMYPSIGAPLDITTAEMLKAPDNAVELRCFLYSSVSRSLVSDAFSVDNPLLSPGSGRGLSRDSNGESTSDMPFIGVNRVYCVEVRNERESTILFVGADERLIAAQVPTENSFQEALKIGFFPIGTTVARKSKIIVAPTARTSCLLLINDGDDAFKLKAGEIVEFTEPLPIEAVCAFEDDEA